MFSMCIGLSFRGETFRSCGIHCIKLTKCAFEQAWLHDVGRTCGGGGFSFQLATTQITGRESKVTGTPTVRDVAFRVLDKGMVFGGNQPDQQAQRVA